MIRMNAKSRYITRLIITRSRQPNNIFVVLIIGDVVVVVVAMLSVLCGVDGNYIWSINLLKLLLTAVELCLFFL